MGGCRRCPGAAAPEPALITARGTGRRGAVQGWGDAVPAGSSRSPARRPQELDRNRRPRVRTRP
jgi:hypothetical protein